MPFKPNHRATFEHMLSGLAYCRMVYDRGRPVDFVYLEVNPAFETLTGLKAVAGKPVSQVIPGIAQSDPGLLEIYGRVARSGVPERFETYLEALKIWFDVSVYCPKKGYFLAQFDNITQRKKTEKHLDQLGRLYATLSQVNQTIVRTKDQDDLFRSICEIMVRYTGADAAWIGLPDPVTGDLTPVAAVGFPPGPRSADKVVSFTDDHFGRVQTGPGPGSPYRTWTSVPFTVGGPNRGLVSLLYIQDPGPLSDEETRLLEEMALDISFALENISASRLVRQWADAVDHCGVGLVIGDPASGRLKAVNPAFARAVGYTREELVDKPILELYRPEDRDQARRQFEVADRTGSTKYEVVKVRKDGTEFPSLMTLDTVRDRDGKVLYRVATQQDITDQKKAADALEASERNYRTIFDQASDGVFISDQRGNFSDVNLQGARMLGYTREELCRLKVTDVVVGGDRSRVASGFEQLLRDGSYHSDRTYLRKDGTKFLGEVTSTVLSDGRVQAFVRDVTDQRRNAEALQESETLFRSIFHGIPDSAVFTDENRRIRMCNPAFERLFGYTAGEVLGKTTGYLYADQEAYIHDSPTVEGSTGPDQVRQIEVLFRRKDGSVFWAEVTVTRITQADGRTLGFFGFQHDLTGRKELFAQLLQSQKLEGLGTLSAGIAHDFNNILGVILGNSTLLETLPADPAQVKKRAQAIARAGARGADLVKQLLTFARKSEVSFKSLDLNNLVRETAKILSETFPKSVTVVEDLAPTVPLVLADETQVHQVLLNLCVNARDAMAAGGTLTLGTSVDAGGSRGKSVVVTVADTGLGIDESTKERIFEPFFTTKAPGKGTGLGLSMVFGIMESHHGTVQVRSVVGEGTVFACSFPVPEEIPNPEPGAPGTGAGVSGGPGTLLLVEDEPGIRDFLGDYLGSQGYEVLTASDGLDGWAVFQAHRSTVDLLITDLGLPNLGGDELYSRIAASGKPVPLVVTSGFFEPEKTEKLRLLGVTEFFQKPYDPREVLGAVRRLLGSK